MPERLALNKELRVSIGIASGILYGIAYTYCAYLDAASTPSSISTKVLEGLLVTIFLPIFLHIYKRLINEKVFPALIGANSPQCYRRLESVTYSVWLAAGGFFSGIAPSIPLTLALGMVFLIGQMLVLGISIPASDRRKIVVKQEYVAFLFLISGFSALIYQNAWQRSLVTLFGVNSESVTVIVSVFMLGLGAGALLGGYLQRQFPKQLLSVFLALEVGIGLFGIVSMDVIQGVGQSGSADTLPILGAKVYAVLMLPTLMMGATLPVLIAYLQDFFKNMGKTTSLLYAMNTFGSAIAAFATVEVLFVYFGLKASVLLAAALNLITAALIFHSGRAMRNNTSQVMSSPYQAPLSNLTNNISFHGAFILLMLIGFIALSQEIVWIRILGFMTGGKPQVFGLVLTATLVGIASGALRAKRYCDSGSAIKAQLSRTLLVAALAFYFSVPLLALISTYWDGYIAVAIAYILIGLITYASGMAFPLLMRVADTGKPDAPLRASWLYFGNIVGASVGPLFTGFLMLEWFTLPQNILFLTGLTVLMSILLIFFSRNSLVDHKKIVAWLVGVAALMAVVHPYIYLNYLEKLQFDRPAEIPFKHVVEGRAGIITVDAGRASNIIYGGGVYDGSFNSSAVSNTNGIDRAYMVAALHRQPAKVLEIGLSSGSWANVVASHSGLEHLTIVEINPGYAEIIDSYADQRKLLVNPRVTLEFDDGRRWLRNNRQAKFDFILMNTTFHWRSNASNLLSREFLTLCKTRLNPGGVVYFNTTGSMDAAYTAASVFQHIVRYRNFIAASDSPFDLSEDEKRENFMKFVDESGNSIFLKDTSHRNIVEQFIANDLHDQRAELLNTSGLTVITDDNMFVEFGLAAR